MPYVITTKTPPTTGAMECCRSKIGAGRCKHMITQSQQVVATLDEATIARMDAIVDATPDTGEGGAWHTRSDFAREVHADLLRIAEGDKSVIDDYAEATNCKTLAEALAAVLADVDEAVHRWIGAEALAGSCCSIAIPGGAVIEVEATVSLGMSGGTRFDAAVKAVLLADDEPGGEPQ